jgi:hypothetical protein
LLHTTYGVLIESLELDPICSIAVQILEQKALCQQDPDQDENDEAPEDQAEYDSVLISSAGDLVAALAEALGADFAQAFGTFFPLISKYYVSTFERLIPHLPLTLLTIVEKRSVAQRPFFCHRMPRRDHQRHEGFSYAID